MPFRRRPARPNDLCKCVNVLAAHPILGPRYAGILADLQKVMLSLLEREAFNCTVFEEIGPPVRILGGAVSSFVQDSFLRQLKTPPSFWGTPELVLRELSDRSAILSDQEVRYANSNDGLSMYVWHTGMLEEDLERMEVATLVLSTFIENFRGYNLKEFLGQAESWRQFGAMRQAGGCFVRPSDGQYAEYHEAIKPADVAKTPLLVGTTREMARGRTIGSMIALLFNYTPPRLGLRRSHQRLVLAALAGQTDEELSKELGVSLAAVKKAWREISNLMAPYLPLVGDAHGDGHRHSRGKQKRHHLLAYFREHPEELRPIERQRANTNGHARATPTDALHSLAH